MFPSYSNLVLYSNAIVHIVVVTLVHDYVFISKASLQLCSRWVTNMAAFDQVKSKLFYKGN